MEDAVVWMTDLKDDMVKIKEDMLQILKEVSVVNCECIDDIIDADNWLSSVTKSVG